MVYYLYTFTWATKSYYKYNALQTECFILYKIPDYNEYRTHEGIYAHNSFEWECALVYKDHQTKYHKITVMFNKITAMLITWTIIFDYGKHYVNTLLTSVGQYEHWTSYIVFENFVLDNLDNLRSILQVILEIMYFACTQQALENMQ